MIIFSLYMMIAMLMIGGVAFDLMRYENLRTRIQATTDAATLAAANLNNSQDPEFVVNDYFEKAFGHNATGSTFLQDIKVNSTSTSRTVSARADASVRTTFMQWSGVDELEMTTLGTARQDVGEIEIAMVLDVSGSMVGNRETNMRTAAKKFVDTVYPEPLAPVDERPTVSFIPYNDQVNLGSTFGPFFNITQDHTYSWCARLPEDEYETLEWDNDVTLERIAHYDRVTNSSNASSEYESLNNLPTPQCPIDETNAILMHEHDPAKMITYIDDIVADYWSWTAISMGAKFGLAMLDPSSKELVTDMVNGDTSRDLAPVLSSRASGLPKNYSTNAGVPNTKIMVLMTDGANTRQFDAKDGSSSGEPDLKTGNSPVYFSQQLLDDIGSGDMSEAYSVDLTAYGYSGWWYYSGGVDHDNNSSTPEQVYLFGQNPIEFLGYGDATVLSNPALFARHPAAYIGAEIFGGTSPGYWNYSYSSRGTHYSNAAEVYNSYDDLDDQTEALCDAAKAKGIVIYAVAFEAPDAGEELMQHCANPAENYFNVTGTEVVVAFEAIARNINQLKLTQ
ncbi:MAG: pilus assembly protein TadG-related protein [Pseudomonadota bacterium]